MLTKYNESKQVINAALCGHEDVEGGDHRGRAGRGRRRHLGGPARRPPRRAGVVHQAAGQARGDRAVATRASRCATRSRPAASCACITKADIVSDLDAYQLAKDITKRIEAEMQYPGHIKVVVIRETRAVEVAK